MLSLTGTPKPTNHKTTKLKKELVARKDKNSGTSSNRGHEGTRTIGGGKCGGGKCGSESDRPNGNIDGADCRRCIYPVVFSPGGKETGANAPAALAGGGGGIRVVSCLGASIDSGVGRGVGSGVGSGSGNGVSVGSCSGDDRGDGVGVGVETAPAASSGLEAAALASAVLAAAAP
jgi:hypothetical protein